MRGEHIQSTGVDPAIGHALINPHAKYIVPAQA
jgi:hypothetical protein